MLPVDTFVVHNAMLAGTVQNCANKNIAGSIRYFVKL